MTDFFRCKNCLMPNTRPRITYNKDGICNACTYHLEKQEIIDWHKRQDSLKLLCESFKKNDGEWDVIVPASGGKDSTYIAHILKTKFNMNPLTVTFAPQIPSWLDRRNWENFVYTGFDNILITPNMNQYKKYAKEYFIKYGLPRQPFVTGISTAIIEMAYEKNINFIMFAENGEMEYGGATIDIDRFSTDFLKNIYYEGQSDQEKYGQFWKVPTQGMLEKIFVTWMSYFEDWEPERNSKIAVSEYGLEMPVGGNIGTFTNYSQIGDSLQDFHMYLAFVKFGFGRCCSDASIEIRRGRLERSEGLKIVNELDGIFPYEFLDIYLDYFQMTESEFWNVIDGFANKDILIKTNKPEKPWELKNEKF